jgi:hypothetical protein
MQQTATGNSRSAVCLCRYARDNGKGLQEHARDISELPSARRAELTSVSDSHCKGNLRCTTNGLFDKIRNTKDTPFKKKLACGWLAPTK